ELLVEQREGASHHAVDPYRLGADRRHPTEGAEVRDDRRGPAHLPQRVAQLVQEALPVGRVELDVVDRVPDEQADVVERVGQVAHDVEERPAALLAPADTLLELVHPLEQARVGLEDARLRRGLRTRAVRDLGGGHAWFLSVFRRSSCWRRDSTSFSKAIILSSRPTTTSSNFSRSRIFSCSSACEARRSRTTRS